MMTEKEALTHVKAVQAHLIERLKAMPEVVLNSPENALPYIVNLSAGRVRAETMLHFLAERNIFVSSGSACGKAKPSHVLSAMQLPKERIETSLRVSLSAENTAEEKKLIYHVIVPVCKKLGIYQLAAKIYLKK